MATNLTPEYTVDERTKKFLKAIRSSNPAYRYDDDATLYYRLKKDDKIPKQYKIKEIDAALGKVDDGGGGAKELVGLAYSLDKMGDFLPNIGWVKEGYERSLTGTARRLKAGERKFDLTEEDDELGIVEDILATAISFVMPLDVLTMGLGHKTGATITRGAKIPFGKRVHGVGQYWQKKANKKLTSDGFKGLSTNQQMFLGAVEGALPLSYYEGSMGYVNAKINNQNPDNEYLNPWAELAKGVVHGGIFGGATGIANGGILGRRASIANKYKNGITKKQLKKLPFGDRFAWKAANPLVLRAIESGIFTGAGTIEKMWGDEDITLKGVLGDWAHNYGLFTVVNAQKKLFGGMRTSIGDVTQSAIRKAANKAHKGIVDKVKTSIDEKYAGDPKDSSRKLQKDLDKELESFNESGEKVIEIKNDVEEKLIYVLNSLSKGEKAFNSDTRAVAYSRQIGNLIGNFREKLKELNIDPKDVRFDALEKEMKEFEKLYEEKVVKKMDKDFNDSLEGEKETPIEKRQKIEWELKARNVNKIEIGGKEFELWDPSISTKQLEILLDIKKKASIEEKGIETETKIDEIDRKLDISDKKIFKEGKDPITGETIAPKGGDIHERRQWISKFLNQKPLKKLGSVALQKFNESAKYIDHLLQKHYPEHVPAKGAARIQKQTVQNQVSHLRQFAEYLAKKGKSFTEATDTDVKQYFAEPNTKRSSHDTAINRLISTMHRLRLGESSFRTMPDILVKSLTKKILTTEEITEAEGLKYSQTDITKGQVQKITTKKGVYKEVPLSQRVVDLLKKVRNKFKKKKYEGESIGRDVEGRRLRHSHINSFIAKIIKPLGKGKSEARAFRNVLKDWAEGRTLKVAGKELLMTEFVKKIGLGQITGRTLEAMYGIKPARAKQIYKKIINEFTKDIQNHISGKKKLPKSVYGVKEEGAYNLIEIAEGLKNIVEGKGNIKIKNQVTGKEFEMERDMSEFLYRYMLEVPSRLIELGPKDLTKKQQKLSDQAKEILDAGEKDLEKIEINLDKAGENGGKTPFEKKQAAIDAKKESDKIKKLKKEFKGTEEYGKRLDINKPLKGKKGLEAELKKLRGDKSVDDIRLENFGATKYKIDNLETGINSQQLATYKKDIENAIKDAKNPRGIEAELQNKGLTSNKIKKLVTALGVRDGNVTKLTIKATKKLRQMLEDYDIGRPHDFNSPKETVIDKKYELGDIRKYLGGYKKFYMAGWSMVQNLAWKSTGSIKRPLQIIEDGLSKLDIAYSQARGWPTEVYNNVKKILNAKSKELTKDLTWADNRIMEEVIKVVETGISPITKKEVDADVMKRYKEVYDKNIDAYNNKTRLEGSAENIGYEGIRYTFERIFHDTKTAILKANKNLKKQNPEEYKRLEKYIDNLYVEDYMPGYLTRKAKEEYDDLVDFDVIIEKKQGKILEKKARTQTEKELKSKLKLKKKELRKHAEYKALYKKNLEKLENDKVELASAREQAMDKFRKDVERDDLAVESPNFMSRKTQLPLFVKYTNGKIIRSYEHSMYNVLNAYYLNMARFSSAAKAMPEYLSPKFYRVKGERNVKTSMNYLEGALKRKDKESHEYLQEIINEMLGTKGSKAHELLKGIANFGAVAGLSGIGTPGLKNLLLGQVQILSTFRMGDYVKVAISLMSRDKWNKARENAVKQGAIDYVLKEFGQEFKPGEVASGDAIRAVNAVGENTYRWSLMTKAENLNRIIAIEVSKLAGARSFEVLSNPFYSESEKNESARQLKESFRFTEEEVGFAESGAYKKPENLEKYNYLLDKIEIFGHKTTQGGVEVLDVPPWMSREYTKPLLVFQRIAASVTNNIAKNIVAPALNGNFAPLLKYTVANYVSGAIMYGVFKNLFKQEDPKSLGSELDRAFMYLGKAEFVGILGMVFDNAFKQYNPHHRLDSFDDLGRNLSPVIVRLLYSAGKEIFNASKQYKSWSHALNDWGRTNIVLYSQIDKLKRNRLQGKKSKEYLYFKDTKNYLTQYQKEKDTYVHPVDWGGNIKQPYYRDLKDAIYFSSQQEIIQQYYDAYNYLVTYLEKDGGFTKKARSEMAHDMIVQSLNHMNPVNLSGQVKSRYVSKKDAFYNWLARKGGEKAVKKAKRAENIYQRNMRIIDAISTSPSLRRKYREKFSVYPY